jgi:hypothetical protein
MDTQCFLLSGKIEEARINIMQSKAIPVTGLGGLLDCEMLRILHCLDNRLADGGKVVRPAHRPHFTPQKHYFPVSGTHFCWRLSEAQGLVRPEGLGKLKNFVHLIGSRTCDFPPCSIAP